MTKAGLRLSDVGEVLTWNDLRDFIVNLPPTHESALYRVRHPQSWWWTPDHDFLGAVIAAIQWGNWQRGGGKGDKPKQIARPIDKPRIAAEAIPTSAADLRARKQKLKDDMERRAVD